MLLALMLPFASQAQQTLTVYDGTTTNSYVPFYGLYADTYGAASEVVFPSDQLGEMAGGSISSMTFYIGTPASAAWTGTHQVYLSEIAGTTLSGITGPTNATVVFTGQLDATGSTLTITFDTPFEYQGGNLLVGSFVSVAGNWKSAYFNGVSQNSATGWYRSSSTSAGSSVSFLPKTTFTYEAGGDPAPCSAVRSLHAEVIRSNGVALAWEDPNNTNATYTVYAINGNDTVALTADQVTIVGTSADVTGLTPITDYTFGVQADCGADGLSDMRTVSVHTACGPVPIPFTEYFGAAVSNAGCWFGASGKTADEVFAGQELTLGAISGWQYKSSAENGIEAGHYRVNIYGTGCKYWLVTPEIDLTNATTAQLSFDAAFTVYSGTGAATGFESNSSQKFMVIVSTDGGTTWLPANATIWDTDTTNTTTNNLADLAGSEYINVVIPLTQYIGGTVKIAFYAQSTTSGGDNNFHIDNILVGEVPTCQAVTGLTVGDIFGRSAVLSWNHSDETTDFVVEYKKASASTWESVDASGDTVFTLIDLDPVTAYQVRVSANCGTDGISYPSVIRNFTTKAACQVPTNVTVQALSRTATVTWRDTLASAWQLQYIAGTGTAADTSDIIDVTDGTSYVLDNLEPETAYKVRVLANCGDEDSLSAWTSWKNFNTPAACQVPANLTATTNPDDFSTATVRWVDTLATSWELCLVQGTDTTDGIAVNDSTVYVFEGLEPETQYKVRVRAYCGEEDELSNWSSFKSFTTPVACHVPYGLSVVLTPGDGSVATINWKDTLATAWTLRLVPGLDGEDTTLIEASDSTYDFGSLTPETPYKVWVRANCDNSYSSSWTSVLNFTPTDAYIVTVNDGTNTNTYVPIYGLYVDDHIKSQFVIPAADLSAMAYGFIDKMTFYTSSSQADCPWTGASFAVYLTETDTTAVGTLLDVANMTQVYAGSLSISGKKMEVTLTTPYLYMGGNLLVAFEQPTSGTYKSSTWVGVSRNGVSMGGYGSSISQQNFLPKTTFNFTPGDEPTCFAVNNVAVDTATGESITISWEDEQGVSYNIYKLVANDSAETGFDTVLVGTTSDLEYTIEGLQSSTAYTFAVEADCGGTGTSMKRFVSGSTGCAGSTCDITLVLHDSYGDGWNGNKLVVVAGGDENSYTISSGSSATYNVSVCQGASVTLKWTTGSYPSETSFEVLDGADIQVYACEDGSTLTNGAVIATIQDPCPSCLPVTELEVVDDDEAVTANSIAITWESEGSAFVLYKNGVAVATIEDETEYTFENLTPNTAYVFGVANLCEDDDTAMVRTIEARTACAAIDTLPYTCGFEASEVMSTTVSADQLPYCWTRYNNATGTSNYYPLSSSLSPRTGSRALQFYGSTNSAYASRMMAILPEIDVEAIDISGLQLTYWARTSSATGAVPIMVGTLNDPEDASSFVVLSEDTIYGNEYQRIDVNLDEADAVAYVAIAMDSNATTVYVDDVTLRVAPTCAYITNLAVIDSTITDNSFTITWHPNEGSTYTIYNGTEVVVSGSTDTAYTFTGLSGSTDYTVGVQAVCANGSSAEIIPVTVATACGTISNFPFTEGFEHADLGCWTNQTLSGTSTWTIGTGSTSTASGAYTGSNYAMAAHTTTGASSLLISPAINTNGAAAMKLSYAHIQKAWVNDIDELHVLYRTSATGTWNTVASYTDAFADWTLDSIILPGATYQVAFEYVDAYGYGVGVDNVVLTAMAQYCYPVGDITVDSVNKHYAKVSWEELGAAEAWQIAVGTTDTIYVTDSSFYEFGNLVGDTTYTIKVRAFCGDDNQSDWSNTVSFHTLELCPDPYDIEVIPGPTTASVVWADDNHEDALYTIINLSDSVPVVVADSIAFEELPYPITGLDPDSSYLFGLLARCSEANADTVPFAFRTAINCPVPYNLTIVDSLTTANSATLEWIGFSSNYNVRYCSYTPTEDIVVFSDGFENGMSQWTIHTEGETASGQTDGWFPFNPSTSSIGAAHGGDMVASAWSWNSDVIDADNWLITPQVPLGGTLKFWVYANTAYPDSYEVLLSTSGNANANFTTTLQAMAPAPTTGEWTEVTINLSQYAGQQGYIAFHHEDYDENYLFIDDVQITVPNINMEGPWTVVTADNTTVTLTGLNPETAYVVQVQPGCNDSVWSASAIFETLPSCLAVTNLAVVDSLTTSSSISLQWTNPNDGDVTFVVTDGDSIQFTLDNVTNTSCTVIDLEPNTLYNFYVAVVCGSDDTSYVAHVNGRTACGVITELPYEEGFEEDGFYCWTLVGDEGTIGLLNNATYAHASTRALASLSDGYMILPAMDTNISALTLSFYWRNYSTSYAAGMLYVGYVNGTDVTTFVAVDSINMATGIATYTQTNPYSFLQAPAGSRMALKHVAAANSSNPYVFVDDVTVDLRPACMVPFDLAVNYTNGNQAVVNWTSDAAAWNLSLNDSVINVTEKPYTLTDLAYNTTYTVKVQAVCGNDTSEWTNTVSFTTDELCPEGKICVGNGTTTNSNLPTNTFYKNSLTQQIYTAAALGAGDTIVSVDFYSTVAITRNVDIYMVSTTKSSFTSSTDWVTVTEANLVFSGNVNFVANDWTTIDFSHSFTYDGTNNVVLVFDDNTGSYQNGPTFRTFSSAANQSIYVRSDGTNYNPASPANYSGTRLNEKNRVRFGVGAAIVPPTTYTVTVTVNDQTMGHVEGAPTEAVPADSSVTLTAVAETGYHFVNWVGANGAVITDNPYTFTVTGNITLQAVFAANEPTTHTVTVTSMNPQMGTVNPEGDSVVNDGSSFTATATANDGYHFVNWVDAGGNVITDNPYTFVVNSNVTLRAVFAVNPAADSVAVTIAVNDANMGTTTPTPGLHYYHVGETLTVTATPNNGYHLDHWSVQLFADGTLAGDTIFAENPLTVPVSQEFVEYGISATLTAVFAQDTTPQQSYTVTVNVNDSTMGHVTGVPTAPVTANTVISLTAVPEAGYHFVSWSNGANTATITVTVTSDTVLTANFAANPADTYTLTVAYDATMGSVEGIPEAPVAAGTVVTLTAMPAEGYHFVEWSTGETTATISVTVNSNMTLAATFAANAVDKYEVKVLWDATMGNVTGVPTDSVPAGSSVTLMANPLEGYEFVAWMIGQDTVGHNAVYTIDSVSHDVTLVAIFAVKTGIEDVEMSNVKIYSAESVIYVMGAEGQDVYLYDLNGRVINAAPKAGERVEFRMNNTGVYLVKVGTAAAKRVVVTR